MPLISVLRDVRAILYHIFYEFSAYVMVVPVRRAGAGWVHKAPGATPPPGSSHAIANMLGTCVQLPVNSE